MDQELAEKPDSELAAQEDPGADRKKREASDWIARIEARLRKFEQGWYKPARAADKMYECLKQDTTQTVGDANPFNILYSNTEVLLPSLYSATPRPDVASRFENPKEPAKVAENMLVAIIDDNNPGIESLDSAVEGAVLSALVPGAGGVRVRAFPRTACPIRFEEFKYDQLVWGYARKWSRVPWVAFLHNMSKEEIVSEYGLSDEQAARLHVPTQEEQDTNPSEPRAPRESGYVVYELWIRASRSVLFLCADYDEKVLREVPNDPLQLQGFFPTPGPLSLVRKPSGMDPTPLYEYYRNQAEELNRVTTRLNRVLRAIKVRGVYNSLIGSDLQQILSDDNMENAMSPSQNPMDLQGGGFEKQIWLLPIEKLIQVAQQLYLARTQIKQVIYEITGLSDIIRGSSVASETATAQDLKNKWGTVRLRRMQRIVSMYVRDVLRIALDAATTVIPPEQWKSMTGLPYPLAVEKQQAQMQLQQMQLAQQQQAVIAQATGQQPPPPQQPPPQLVQAATSPSWEELLAKLRNDGMRDYSVDIETASTIDTDAMADKQEVIDFMGALAQLMQGLGPLVALGPEGLNAAKTLVLAVCKRFRFGREVEDAFRGITTPPPPQGDKGPSPEEVQMQQAELAMKKQELAFKGQEMQFKARQLERQAILDEQEHKNKMAQQAAAHQQAMQKLVMQAAVQQSKPQAPARKQPA